jgi:uncharacterized protein
MKRDEVVAALKREEASIRRFGATALYLFGSAARDEIGPDSDIDVFIEYDRAGKFTLFELSGLQAYLTERFQREVDVCTRSGLHPRLRNEIERSSIRII